MKNWYVLSDNSVIVELDPDWDATALANGAPDAMADNVLGHRIWKFVDGFDVRSYLNAIFFACRDKRASLTLEYRCDTDRMKRVFRMGVSYMREDVLKVSSELVHEEPIPDAGNVIQLHEDDDRSICAVCMSLKIGADWVDPFHLSASERAFSVSEVCPNCKVRAAEALSRLTPGGHVAADGLAISAAAHRRR